MQVTLLLNDPSSFSFACPKEKKQPACAGRKKKATRSKTHFHAKRSPDNYIIIGTLPAEKCLNQFEYDEFSAKTTFLKVGQPAWPQCVHADRGRPVAPNCQRINCWNCSALNKQGCPILE